MTPRSAADPIRDERHRLRLEYRRREREIDPERYAPWQPEVLAERAGRLRAACRLLANAGAFPRPGDACLEIGYGSAGWLADLLAWGVRETSLHGIELDETRAERARRRLPAADLRVGDAVDLPWPDDTFKVVIISTVVSSILDDGMRQRVCAEAMRVVAGDGAIIWYDLRRNNPSNAAVRRVAASDLRSLFPGCRIALRSATLAPPLARLINGTSDLAARALESVPMLRTHLVAVIQKGTGGAA